MEHPTFDASDGFPARLRYVVNSYGSANALAGAIERSEGALRKWLRGKSEPTVSDLRAICEATHTSIEWLVTGRGDPKGFGIRSPAPCSEAQRRDLYRRCDAGEADAVRHLRRLRSCRRSVPIRAWGRPRTAKECFDAT
jgi:transcriptional regulator with XRE-family HTH domain